MGVLREECASRLAEAISLRTRHLLMGLARGLPGKMDAMKFFIPFARDDGAAELIYRTVARRCVENSGIQLTPDRVFAVRYRFRESEYLAQVGISHPPGEPEVVICILASEVAFFICTRMHGVNYGTPMIIPRNLVSDVEYFNGVCDEIA